MIDAVAADVCRARSTTVEQADLPCGNPRRAALGSVEVDRRIGREARRARGPAAIWIAALAAIWFSWSGPAETRTLADTPGAASRAKDAVVLAEDGKARATIIANGHAPQAKALAEYLEQIVGSTFPVVETLDAAPAGHAAIVLAVAADIPGLSSRPVAQQGYRIHVEAGRVHLTGRTPQGLTYAVYGFLDDHLGVRFYAPDVEKVPRKTSLSIGPLDDRQEPAFLARAFSQPYGHPLARQEPLYREKNRAGTPPITAHHNYYTWIPASEFAAHPQWFPIIDGQRRTHHAMPLCATNAELAGVLAGKFMASMEKLETKRLFAGYPLMLSAAQGDGFAPCECRECRALAEREGSEAAPYLQLLNRALEITSAKYPSHRVITFAYFGTLKTPKTLRPHRNLWINVVSSSLSPYPAGDQLGPIRDNPHNRDYREAIQTWTRLAPGRVAIWDWTSNFTDATLEWPNLYSVADNIRFFRENAVETVFLEQPGGEQNWGWLRKWVWSRMMWNPERDPRALVREFVFDYYGDKAGPFIWAYHEYVDRLARESRYGTATVRWTAFPDILRRKLFPDNKLSAMTALLEGALNAAAADPVHAERVRQAMGTSVDTLLLADAGLPARVKDPRDGSPWVVPGGRRDFPARIDRVADAWLKTTAAGAESWHFRYRFLQRTGGRLERLSNDQLAVEALPAVRGQIYSLVHVPTGKELLAPGDDLQIGGYTDRLPGATTTIGWQETEYHARWLGESAGGKQAGVLTMFGVPVTSPWDTPRGLLSRRHRYQIQRNVTLAPGAGTLVVGRRYVGRRIRPEQQVFEAAWSFAVPEPAKARLTIREGRIEHRFDLGGLRREAGRAQPGDRPIPITDVTIQDFDVVEGKSLTIETKGDQGDIVILLDRGDGLAVELTTPSAGNRTLALTPAPGKRRITVAVGSAARALPADKDAEVELPAQTLCVKVTDPQRLAAETRTAKNPKDGAEMVWIPAGHSRMGSPDGEGNPDESPQRRVYLDGYWIYRHPVTVARYRAFCEATGRAMPALPGDSAGDDHPIFNINWHDARAYAEWAGASLPTEAQWEKAARGTDGRTYPWGNTWDPDRCVSPENTRAVQRYGTRPVGSHPAGASPYGVMDMAGQIWEWVADWYAADAYRTMPEVNPTGPERGRLKVLRGGSLNWDEWHSRSAYRNLNPPDAAGWVQAGFRCVKGQP